jgi:subtilase family serine protease
VGPRGQGAGVNLAVFEQSAYQHADIETWAHTFYGKDYKPPLVDINVDGGPLNPICPAGDSCALPDLYGYAADGEVDEDVEMELAIAPAAKSILVYNAPFDLTGQTALDEETQMANDNRADVISSSYYACELLIGAGFLQAENILLEQMAAQGQSVFAASGDFGAFTCAPYGLADPASQPWVTAVGGTSFESFNPGADPNPKYPEGVETVWNSL